MAEKFNTLHYLIAMLKKYEIHHIVASPGVQNSRFNSLVQDDDYFKCFSVIDERSAAYVAGGIINETQKPVVITCTGATASRNYPSGLTEAFYRKLPIIAITFFNPFSSKYNMEPQFVDRTVTQNDVKSISVVLPLINTQNDAQKALVLLNLAFSEALNKKMPVHINCPSNASAADYENNVKELPEVWKTDYVKKIDNSVKNKILNKLKTKKTCIFIGSHNKFSDEGLNNISSFAKKWKIPVFCDHTSNYKGENKILTAQAFSMIRSLNRKPELIIDIGNISGDYTYKNIFNPYVEVWRIADDEILKFRNDTRLSMFFDMPEASFFEKLLNTEDIEADYYSEIKNVVDKLSVPNLPMCNAFICNSLAKHLPQNCSLHLTILNSLRNMNFFNLDNSIDVTCNVGGFGIDGGISTLVGQSLANPNHKCFGLAGDTAFFYDMNIIGNRHISNNLRIILVNNGKGIEFRLNKPLEKLMGDKTDVLIASGGHNKGGAEGWGKSCGFEYMSARTKEEFLSQIDNFCNGEFDKPVLFEVFTTTENEQEGVRLMTTHNRNKLEEAAIGVYKAFKH